LPVDRAVFVARTSARRFGDCRKARLHRSEATGIRCRRSLHDAHRKTGAAGLGGLHDEQVRQTFITPALRDLFVAQSRTPLAAMRCAQLRVLVLSWPRPS
jgi:hypothetical protein